MEADLADEEALGPHFEAATEDGLAALLLRVQVQRVLLGAHLLPVCDRRVQTLHGRFDQQPGCAAPLAGQSSVCRATAGVRHTA